jgi:UDP-N-acetylmuramyl pentapeptide phosphotransferase/UDP-N-acetylglucosamine-1-phosphate transferase
LKLLLETLGAGIVGAAAEIIILYLIINMLKETGAVRKNYLDMDIPVSVGISFPLSVMIVYILYTIGSRYEDTYHLFLIGLVFMCWLGFVDDMLGKRDTLGFKGHFGAVFKGRLTTGGLKAIGGGLIALFIASFISDGWFNIIINTFIIALFTNTLNLLDLRPGRAVKGFIIFFIAMLTAAWGRIDFFLVSPLLGAVLVYFPFDLKAKVMMGDSGSNVLGFSLGYLAASSLSLNLRLLVLIMLVGIHLYTEKFSLTKTIENNIILKGIDQLGRGN